MIYHCPYRSDDPQYNNEKGTLRESAWGHLFISQNAIIQRQSFPLSRVAHLPVCIYK